MKPFIKRDSKQGAWKNAKKSSPKSSWDRGTGEKDQMGRSLHQVKCAECGTRCEVPFKPTGSKPVFCGMCFKKGNGKDDRKPFRSGGERPSMGSGERNNDSLRADMKAIHAKLDAILEALAE